MFFFFFFSLRVCLLSLHVRIRHFYAMHGLKKSDATAAKNMRRDAWCAKKFCSFIKLKVRKAVQAKAQGKKVALARNAAFRALMKLLSEALQQSVY